MSFARRRAAVLAAIADDQRRLASQRATYEWPWLRETLKLPVAAPVPLWQIATLKWRVHREGGIATLRRRLTRRRDFIEFFGDIERR